MDRAGHREVELPIISIICFKYDGRDVWETINPRTQSAYGPPTNQSIAKQTSTNQGALTFVLEKDPLEDSVDPGNTSNGEI